jgi:hypothetical protein
VRAEDPHVAVRFLELSKTLLVVTPHPIVDGDRALGKFETPRRLRRAQTGNVHLARVKIRVAAVKEPARLRAHRDGRVPARVTVERDE